VQETSTPFFNRVWPAEHNYFSVLKVFEFEIDLTAILIRSQVLLRIGGEDLQFASDVDDARPSPLAPN
jgi:hypothetical protein